MSVKVIEAVPMQTNVPVLGSGAGGKILKDQLSNALIQFGEYGENDTTITTDDGVFGAGGALFIADSESAIYFAGSARYSASSASNIMRFEAGHQIIMSKPAAVNLTSIVANTGEITLGSALDKLGLFDTAPVVQPTAAIGAAAFVANTSGIVNDSATYGGYTGGQIVAALQLLGILA